jgi:PRTRC genetic system protein A
MVMGALSTDDAAGFDSALLTANPLIAMPRFGKFTPLENNGHRFVVGRNGLFVEVSRPWLYAMWPLTDRPITFPIPYGEVQATLRLLCGGIPDRLLALFHEQACKALPNETAAWITFDAGARVFRYHTLAASAYGPSRLDYITPHLGEDEHLVLDMHSHGRIPAFFSRDDDADDYGAYKLAAVLGGLDGAPEWKLRLCLGGIFFEIERGMAGILSESDTLMP